MTLFASFSATFFLCSRFFPKNPATTSFFKILSVLFASAEVFYAKYSLISYIASTVNTTTNSLHGAQNY